MLPKSESSVASPGASTEKINEVSEYVREASCRLFRFRLRAACRSVGGYRLWLEAQTKIAVAGAYKLCSAVELYSKESGHYPADHSDIVKLLQKETSPRNSAPYLYGNDPFLSQEEHFVEYRRNGANAIVIVVRPRPAGGGTLKPVPSVRCESPMELNAVESRSSCGCETAP